MSATPAAMSRLHEIKQFLAAGSAKFTLVSKVSGKRKTFEVLRVPPRPPDVVSNGYFVRLLVGPDNGSDFRYLGFMAAKGANLYFYPGKKDACANPWGEEAIAAFSWVLRQLNAGWEDHFNKFSEFWHSGSCARCGRELTDPESIVRGLGPKCAGY